MAETTVHESSVRQEAASGLSVEEMVAEMGRLFVEMKQYQTETERLQEENKARLTRIETALEKMDVA